MDDSPTFALPETFATVGDPVPTNPFPADTTRHDVWKEATRVAEVEICQLNANAHGLLTAENYLAWPADLTAAKFDVWAKRTLVAVFSDQELANYDQWLLTYANALIAGTGDVHKDAPPEIDLIGLLTHLRNRLGSRVQHWKAVARRWRADQERHRAELNPTPTKITDGIVKRRESAVRDYRKGHELTAVAFARQVGISETAILGLIHEDRTRFSEATQRHFLAALGFTKDDWYRE